MHIIMVFIDGLGLGEPNPEINPLVRFPLTLAQEMFKKPLAFHTSVLGSKGCLVPTDSCLGIDGLPQSATGQTTIFTGINAPAAMGRHIQAFPGPQLREVISRHSIMRQLSEKGLLCTSANMYTPNYFELVANRKRRHSASTLAILSAGLPLRSLRELLAGEAVYQDITNEMLPLFNVKDAPVIAPEVAAERLLKIGTGYHFTLFEYFQTDRCGHKGDWELAAKITGVLDLFLWGLYKNLPDRTAVIICSDHGNFEDMSVKTHTRNPVPTWVFGYKCCEIAEKICALTDITPAIVSVLEGDVNSNG